MEVSLTKTLVQTEAGADASGLPLAQGDATIFDALMAASTIKPGDTTDIVNAQALPLPVDATQAAPQTQTLATDLENMVQALAITAEVVVKGMSERAPIREIILKVESPTIPSAQSTGLPELTALPPVPADELNLKISAVEQIDHLDPVLQARILVQPVSHKVVPELPQSNDVAETVAVVDPELALNVEANVNDIQSEVPHGPFRAEVHGPFIDIQKALIAKPIFTLIVDAPTAPVVSQAATIVAPAISTETPTDIDPVEPIIAQQHEPDGETTTIPILVVKVPLAPQQTAETDLADTHQVILDKQETLSAHAVDHEKLDAEETPATDIVIHTDDIVADMQTAVMLVQQDMPSVQPQFTRAEPQEAADDVLQAPRQHLERNQPTTTSAVHFVAQRQAVDTKSVAEPLPVFKAATLPTAAAPVLSYEEIDAAPETSPAQNTLPQRINLAMATKALVETNVASAVANSSSTSSANIRDLVKLGVRDIEIIQGPSSPSSGAANQTMQILTQDLNAPATRAAVTETAINAGRDNQAAAERRAEAHDIRMKAIERQVIAAVRDGSDTIRMQLYPPGLGQVMIRLTMEGARLKLSTRASSSEAVESLRAIENDLRDALSTSGLELAGFDVSDENDQREGRRERPEQIEPVTRGTKSEDFALDMNA